MSPVEAPRRERHVSVSAARVSGWGRTNPATVTLLRPGAGADIAELLTQTGDSGGLIPRGAGRSYGDAAQNDGGAVLDMTALKGIRAIDSRTGEVLVAAGTTFAELLEGLAAHGLTLPVVPGTAHLTVGGAIAADVHGKNHPRDGSIAMQLSSLTLCTPAEGQVEVSPHDDPALFAATVGGMGLTGPIVAARLRTTVLRRPVAVADIDRVSSVEEAIGLVAGAPHSHAIAWLDLMARGRRFGRGVVTLSVEGEREAGPVRLGLRAPSAGLIARVPPAVLRPASVRAFNRLHLLAQPRRARGSALGIGRALFPLDSVGSWNRLYGRRGLVQYQFAVPSEAKATVREVLELLRAARLPMYLATLKRLGRASGGMLSFPIPGLTLAVDMPAGARGLGPALKRADEVVAAAGGRVYLAKDGRMGPEQLAAMYPDLTRFLEVRARVDPHETLRSDLSRRLGLTR